MAPAPSTKKRGFHRELDALASSLVEPSSKRVRDEIIYSLSLPALRKLLKDAGESDADTLGARQAASRVQRLVKDKLISDDALSAASKDKSDGSSGSSSGAIVAASVARKVEVASPKEKAASKSTAEASKAGVFQSVSVFLSSVFRFGKK